MIKDSTKKAKSHKAALIMGHTNGDSDEGLDMVGFKLTTLGERAIMEIGRQLPLWAREDNKALKISQFFNERGICMSTVSRWCIRFPLFKQLFELAMTIIGDRREIMGLNRQIDTSIVIKTMHIYDPMVRDGLAWMESIKKDHNQDQREITVAAIAHVLQEFDFKKEKHTHE
jgi:hypothetical protein